jgi:hypothetical protein
MDLVAACTSVVMGVSARRIACGVPIAARPWAVAGTG